MTVYFATKPIAILQNYVINFRAQQQNVRAFEILYILVEMLDNPYWKFLQIRETVRFNNVSSW